MSSEGLRIGEVAERAGVSVSTLRAWERRHGILEPERTDGGHRIYRPEDVVRVRAIRELIDRGWSVAAAAREAERGAGPAPSSSQEGGTLDTLQARLWASLDTFDAAAAHQVLDEAFDRFAVVTLLDGLVAPTLRRLGEDWSDDPANITREHLGSQLIRTRLVRLLHEGGSAATRMCLALSPEDEYHDIGTLMAAITLQDAGWYVRFLGAHMPWDALAAVLDRVRPNLLLMGACLRRPAARLLQQIEPPEDVCTVLGGAGFRSGDAEQLPWAVYHTGPLTELPTLVDAALAAH